MLKIYYILLMAFSLSSIEKSFLHKSDHLDKLVLYLNPESKLKTKVYKGGNIRLSVDKTSCHNIKGMGEKVKGHGYSVAHSFDKDNNVCHIDIVSNADHIDFKTPMEFSVISGKNAVSVEINKKNKAKKQAFCSTPLVVIDPGHGGEDFGTPGIGKYPEKKVVLDIALKLKDALAQKGIKTVLTRSKDKFVSLDARTSFANQYGCAVFVSLHANYSSNSDVAGVETYYLEKSLLGKENDERDKLSKSLAFSVQDNLVKSLNCLDRKVRRAISQILYGTNHPSILIELGFLSNKEEAKKLSTAAYQKKVAESLANGISAYFSKKKS